MLRLSMVTQLCVQLAEQKWGENWSHFERKKVALEDVRSSDRTLPNRVCGKIVLLTFVWTFEKWEPRWELIGWWIVSRDNWHWFRIEKIKTTFNSTTKITIQFNYGACISLSDWMLSHPPLCSIISICKLICSTILMRKIRMRKLSFLILPKKNAKFENKSRKLKKMKKSEVYVKYKNLCLTLDKYFNNVWNTFNEVYLSGPWITFIYSSQIFRIWGIQESLKTISCKKINS